MKILSAVVGGIRDVLQVFKTAISTRSILLLPLLIAIASWAAAFSLLYLDQMLEGSY